MSGWEYKVVPAPKKGVKAKSVKGPEERFAHALETLMNDMGTEGWEFQRAETLPSLERSGLTGTTTEWRNVMVFRRVVTTAAEEFEHELLPAPEPVVQPIVDSTQTAAETKERTSEGAHDETSGETDPEAKDSAFKPGVGATQMLADNGVEETSEVAGVTTSLKSLVAQRNLKISKD